MKIIFLITLIFTTSFIKADGNDDYPIPAELQDEMEQMESYYERDYKTALQKDDPDVNRFCANSNQGIAETRLSAVFKPYIPLNPCRCKTLWCFIWSVNNLIRLLRKYFLALAGLPCYLKKKILNIILDFYLRGCPDFLKKLIKAWVNYYIDQWCK